VWPNPRTPFYWEEHKSFSSLIFGTERIMEAIIRNQPRMTMVTIYLLLVAAFLYLRPAVAFGKDGRIRPFGTGQKDSTVFPLWWWVFVLAVVSYLAVVWILGYSL
jgi:hypothetical protein